MFRDLWSSDYYPIYVRMRMLNVYLIHWGSSVTVSPGVTISASCLALFVGRMSRSPSRSTPPPLSESESESGSMVCTGTGRAGAKIVIAMIVGSDAGFFTRLRIFITLKICQKAELKRF